MPDFTVPPDDTNFNDDPYMGSFQQIFADNIGLTVVVDFLIGTSNLVSQTGVIHSVGKRYVTLFQLARRNYVVCDIFSVKFVTFVAPLDSAVASKRR